MKRAKIQGTFLTMVLSFLVLSGGPSQARTLHDNTFYNGFESHRTFKTDAPATGAGPYATSTCANRPGVGGVGGGAVLANDGPTLIQQTCVKCHAGFTKNGFTFPDGRQVGNFEIVSAVESGAMPKGVTLNATQRQALITALSN